MASMKIKKGDMVKVIAGRDKDKEGKVIAVNKKDNTLLVEGVNMVKRHTKPSQTNPQGGIIEKEAPINVSNVMILDPESKKPTRIRKEKQADGSYVRVAVKSGAVLDNVK